MRVDHSEVGALVHQVGMVLLGERHGTNEFPRLTLNLATEAAKVGPVCVALEMGDDALQPLETFMRSSGNAAARRQLLSPESWQRVDGRASEAMFRLVDGLRRIGQGGAVVRIAVFDWAPDDPDPKVREQLLASRLLRARGVAPTLALTGNVHAELMARPDAHEGFIPAAALITEESPLVTLSGRHSGGEAWCTLPIDGAAVSRAHAVPSSATGDAPHINLGPPRHARTGVAHVGRITASPPAAG